MIDNTQASPQVSRDNLGEAVNQLSEKQKTLNNERDGARWVGRRQEIHIWTVSASAEGKVRRGVLGSPRVTADSQLYFPLQFYR